jgi:recombination protein RecR
VTNDPLRALQLQLARLPGIGERTALRLVHHLLRQDPSLLHGLAASLIDVAERVRECQRCCALTASGSECGVCSDSRRDASVLCVVAQAQDQAAIEATGEFHGRYHVLHGVFAPLDGRGPEQLRVKELLARLTTTDAAVAEIIVATPPSVDGEATALYLSRLLQPHGMRLTRIASGVPVGGELQYADRSTLARAIASRRAM